MDDGLEEVKVTPIEKPEPASASVVKTPSVIAAGWLFAALCSGFLVILFVITLQIPSLEISSGKLETGYTLGASVYTSMGCSECHTRLVRDSDIDLGPYATRNSLTDSLVDPGSSRIGPDLQNIDGKYTDDEMLRLLEEPSVLLPENVMPSYKHLDAGSMSALISYLQTPLVNEELWQTIRDRNEIESTVPSNILYEMDPYIDPASLEIISPIPLNEGIARIGSGIYFSRCASCHEGYGTDLGSEKVQELSDAALYWRIVDGIPGRGMPGFRKLISKEGTWYLIAYIRSCGSDFTPYSGLNPWVPGNPVELDDELIERFQALLDANPDKNELIEKITGDIRNVTDSASEDEGVSTGENGTSDGADELSNDPDAGEDSR